MATEIAERGGRAFAVQVDVTSLESLEMAAKQVAAEAGGAELFDEFYAVVSRKWRDLGSPVLPRSFFAAVLDLPSAAFIPGH